MATGQYKDMGQPKLGHNEIADLCRKSLVEQGIFADEESIAQEPWGNLIYDFASENDMKEISKDVILQKFKEKMANNKNESKAGALENIDPVISMLKDTAREIQTLEQAMILPVYEQNDLATNLNNLIKKGELIVVLSEKVDIELKNFTFSNDKQKSVILDMQSRLQYWANTAQESLKDPQKSRFSLDTLLTFQGSHKGDKNDLENIIESLELIK